MWVFKKFQANLNALKSSSDVPLKAEELDQQSQEGRAWQRRVMGSVGSVGSGCRAVGSGKLGMGMMPTNSQAAVAAVNVTFSGHNTHANITLFNLRRA